MKLNVRQYTAEKLAEFDLNNTYTANQLRLLQAQISYIVKALEDALANQLVDFGCEDKTQVFLKNVCNFVIDSESFNFKQALGDYDLHCDITPQAFYSDIWLVPTKLTGVHGSIQITIRNLYTVCSSPKFLDVFPDVEPVQILHGNISEDLLEHLKPFAVSEENLVCMSNQKAELGECSAFCGIADAMFIRNRIIAQYSTKFLDTHLCSIFGLMRESVFLGKDTVSIIAVDVEPLARDGITQMFLKYHLQVVFCTEDSKTDILINCLSGEVESLDKLSEEALYQLLLDSYDGSMYYEVKSQIVNRIVPEIEDSRLKETSLALDQLTLNNTSVGLQKVFTRTDVYERLFGTLRKKGFLVVIEGDNYTIGLEMR